MGFLMRRGRLLAWGRLLSDCVPLALYPGGIAAAFNRVPDHESPLFPCLISGCLGSAWPCLWLGPSGWQWFGQGGGALSAGTWHLDFTSRSITPRVLARLRNAAFRGQDSWGCPGGVPGGSAPEFGRKQVGGSLPYLLKPMRGGGFRGGSCDGDLLASGLRCTGSFLESFHSCVATLQHPAGSPQQVPVHTMIHATSHVRSGSAFRTPT